MAPRRGRKFWSKVVEDYEAVRNRESHVEFTARRKLTTSTFRKWLYELRKSRQPAMVHPVRLLPVNVVEGAADHLISVHLDDGLGLRFVPGTDPTYVAALVAALRPC